MEKEKGRKMNEGKRGEREERSHFRLSVFTTTHLSGPLPQSEFPDGCCACGETKSQAGCNLLCKQFQLDSLVLKLDMDGTFYSSCHCFAILNGEK